MKIYRHISTGILAAAALLLAGSVRIQATPNVVVAAFNTGTQGQPTGGSYQGYNMSVPYGAGTIVWDGVTFDAADGSTGAAYITANFSAANNTDVLVSMGPGYNNWYYEDGQNCPGFLTGTADFTQYHAVQFDILYDTNSALTIAQFNTGNAWPSNYLISGVGSNYMATNSYYTAGVNIDLFTGNNGNTVYLGTFQIPTNADTGWQTVTMPYSDALNGITAGAGLWFQGSFGGGSGVSGGPYNASFWIDNVILVGNVTVAPPPTLTPPAPAVSGLNIFGNTTGLNDRHGPLLVANSGLSWVGNTSTHPTYPVNYSLTLKNFPTGPAYSAEAYMFLVANPAGQESAADYNEANVAWMQIQSTPTGGQAIFQYKANEPAGNHMLYGTGAYTNAPGSFPGGTNVLTVNGSNVWTENGNLGYVQSTKLLGTWTLQFQSPTNFSLIAPDGNSTNLTFPYYYVTNFQENGSTATPFNIYLGMQPNNSTALDQAMVYGSFSLSNVGNNFSENFVGETALNTNYWNPAHSAGPAGIFIVPTNAPYWVDWSLPASGYVLTESASLGPKAIWNNVSTFAPIALSSSEAQLISALDMPGTNEEFFQLVKRTATQLQVLLPGETNAPNTALGYTGSPDPVSLSVIDGMESITVLTVDSKFNPIPGIGDTVSISSSDSAALLPVATAMVNGSVTFGVSNPFFFQSEGSWTVTATDTTNPGIAAGTSASVTVGP